MTTLFWLCLLLVIYIYAGYPVIIYILARFVPANVEKAGRDLSVTVVIAAYNEVDHIAATIENKLEGYPQELLDVMVVSDGSTDGTDDVVNGVAARHSGRVRLLRQEPRQGKTSGLNMAIAQARGEIVVFSDANSIYEPGSIRALVANFGDPRVGYVTGHMVYGFAADSSVGEGSSAFMKYENFLRKHETRFGSVVGVDGGIDAVRKKLYTPMAPDQLPDFVLPLRVARDGYRVVYEPRAVLREDALERADQEYRMRVRVSLRGLWALRDMRELLNPLRHGAYAWQVLSHKVLRYGAFVPLTVLLVVSALLVLADAGAVYALALAGQLAFYLLAAGGMVFESQRAKSRLTTAAYYFTVLNVACAHAFVKFALGQKQTIWKPRGG